jgi:hypothetical protein
VRCFSFSICFSSVILAPKACLPRRSRRRSSGFCTARIFALPGELCRRFRDSLAADSWSGSSVHSITTGSHWFVLVLASVFESLTGAQQSACPLASVFCAASSGARLSFRRELRRDASSCCLCCRCCFPFSSRFARQTRRPTFSILETLVAGVVACAAWSCSAWRAVQLVL